MPNPHGDARPATWAVLTSNLSDFGAIWPLVTLLQVATRRRGALDAMTRLGLVGISALLVTRLLKRSGAERPSGDRSASTWVRTPSSPRFPSGHTLASTAAAVAIPSTTLGEAAGLAFSGAVAASRLELGAHEPADVIAGAGAGLAVGTLVRWAMKA